MSTKAQRRAERERVGRYYEEQVTALLERVRGGFDRYDAGELDAFELDELIHRYKRASRELWKFCGSVTGHQAGIVARMIDDMESQGESIDWWLRGNPPRDRS